MKVYILLLCLFLTGCGYRPVPHEVSALHTIPRKPQIPQKPETIVVDAGHGGKDAGASSNKEKYEEKEWTLSTAFAICDSLKQLGYKPVLTRNHDVYIPLETRADIANSLKADLFVSIHYNYSSSSDAEGVEVYYYKEAVQPSSPRIVESKELAQEVLKKIKTIGAKSRGLKSANFAVIRETKMPAILVEGGFLSNPQEREKLRDINYREELARAIAEGIDQYLITHKK